MTSSKDKQIRKCIVTNQHFNKLDMIRIVSFRGGPIEFDLSGKKNGRGCYVSLDESNLEKLIDKNGALLARNFKKQITKDELEYIKKEYLNILSEKKFRPKLSKNVTIKISRDDYLKSKK